MQLNQSLLQLNSWLKCGPPTYFWLIQLQVWNGRWSQLIQTQAVACWNNSPNPFFGGFNCSRMRAPNLFRLNQLRLKQCGLTTCFWLIQLRLKQCRLTTCFRLNQLRLRQPLILLPNLHCAGSCRCNFWECISQVEAVKSFCSCGLVLAHYAQSLIYY